MGCVALPVRTLCIDDCEFIVVMVAEGRGTMAGRAMEELDQLAEFFQRLEEGEERPFEAVRLLTMFMPDPGAVRQVEYRAYDRANEARVEGNWGEAAHWSSTGDSLAILAERAEKARKEA